MAPTNRVTSILPEPNADGDNVIGITLGDGSTFDVTIDSAAAWTLVEILQRRLHDDIVAKAIALVERMTADQRQKFIAIVDRSFDPSIVKNRDGRED